MGQPPKPAVPRLMRLRAFHVAASLGSMSAAAEALHLTQPAVTRAVQALEQELGGALLERGRAGSFLTEEGSILFRRTQRFFDQGGVAIGKATGEPADGEAVVRIVRSITDVHIRALTAVGKAVTFRGAAHMLGIAEPTLHRPARDLERMMRISLYRRTVDGYALTPTGLELARKLTLAAAEIATALEELAAHRNLAQTTIRIGMLPLAPKRFLAKVVEEFLSRRPLSRIVIEQGLYGEFVAALRSGAIDFIFGVLRTPAAFRDLSEQKLFADSYCIACRRGHPLLSSASARRDLKNYEWVFAATTMRRRAALDAMIAKWKLSPRVQVETNDGDAAVASLVSSDRLALLPRAWINDNLGAIAKVDLRVPQPSRAIGLTTRSDWLPTDLQAEFVELLHAKGRNFPMS